MAFFAVLTGRQCNSSWRNSSARISTDRLYLRDGNVSLHGASLGIYNPTSNNDLKSLSNKGCSHLL